MISQTILAKYNLYFLEETLSADNIIGPPLKPPAQFTSMLTLITHMHRKRAHLISTVQQLVEMPLRRHLQMMLFTARQHPKEMDMYYQVEQSNGVC